MADWDRKRLLDISYAIQRCMSRGKLTEHQYSALARVYEMTHAGTRNVRVNAATVEKVKQALCEVCTTEKLYDCEKMAGSTSDCALLRMNQQ